jgi:hypothetical protein
LTEPAEAESAADKAAAREAATQGIQLFKNGNYPEALDKLKRAQLLYDAPVHLLYMARTEEKLGQLVEASEHYRQLDHYNLPPNPPEAWSAAVEDGRKELTALDPRVPKLRIMTEPQTSDATLRIDGADVSSAALGIPRPINPGKHHVELATPGHAPVIADVDVAEGTSRDVVFRVQAGATEATSTVVATTATEKPAETGALKPQEPASDGPFVGFMGGLRLGLAVPTGTLFQLPGITLTSGRTIASREIAASDYFQAGGTFGFHAGVRLGKYFTPLFFLDLSVLGHQDTSPYSQAGAKEEIDSAQAGSFGIGVRIGTPPGKLGGFGEFDIGLIDAMNVKLNRDILGTKTTCKVEARGASLRFGGGATIPLASWLQLTPMATFSLGRFSTLDATGCNLTANGDGFPKGGDISSGDQRNHGMIFVGVGGDVVVGGRR